MILAVQKGGGELETDRLPKILITASPWQTLPEHFLPVPNIPQIVSESTPAFHAQGR